MIPLALLSLADLWMTLEHLTHIGMFESNPVARAVMSHGSPALLSIWKILSVAFAMGLLYLARRRWLGEAAMWAAVIVLVWLMGRWIVYSDHVVTISHSAILAAEHAETSWVSMTSTP